MLIPTPTQQEIIQLLRAAADISVVAYILYRLILLTKGRRAWQILTGLGVFFLLYFASDWLKLVTLNWLLRQVMPLGPVAIVILFYPELRDVLERLGRADFWGASALTPAPRAAVQETLEEVARAAMLLSPRKTGALIVLARETGLDEIVANSSAVLLDAKVTADLLTTIFYFGTPLHDGAVIIRGDRIVAANCTLPLSDSPNIATNVHTRHRAALGLSEQSDAVIVIVSEETGTVSVAAGGKMPRGFNAESLRIKLYESFGIPTMRKQRRRDKEANGTERGGNAFSHAAAAFMAGSKQGVEALAVRGVAALGKSAPHLTNGQVPAQETIAPSPTNQRDNQENDGEQGS